MVMVRITIGNNATDSPRFCFNAERYAPLLSRLALLPICAPRISLRAAKPSESRSPAPSSSRLAVKLAMPGLPAGSTE